MLSTGSEGHAWELKAEHLLRILYRILGGGETGKGHCRQRTGYAKPLDTGRTWETGKGWGPGWGEGWRSQPEGGRAGADRDGLPPESSGKLVNTDSSFWRRPVFLFRNCRETYGWERASAGLECHSEVDWLSNPSTALASVPSIEKENKTKLRVRSKDELGVVAHVF